LRSQWELVHPPSGCGGSRPEFCGVEFVDEPDAAVASVAVRGSSTRSRCVSGSGSRGCASSWTRAAGVQSLRAVVVCAHHHQRRDRHRQVRRGGAAGAAACARPAHPGSREPQRDRAGRRRSSTLPKRRSSCWRARSSRSRRSTGKTACGRCCRAVRTCCSFEQAAGAS
jgi:hypothetical protein